MIDLIYDRTISDVNRVEYLRQKVKDRTATQEEIAEWLTPLKGAYNFADLNRVGEAMNYLADALNDFGYYNAVSAKTDWVITDKPNPEQMEKYINDLNELKKCFYVSSTTPQTPSNMVSLTYEKANDIEKILVDIEKIFKSMQNYYVFCGVGNCGQSRLWQQRFRRVEKPKVLVIYWETLEQKVWNDFGEDDTWDLI